MQEIVIILLKNTITQIIGIFGIFFVLGFILSVLQSLTNKNYQKSIGWKGILLTAWIGTPIHEIGHVIFATLFRHRIHSVSLFHPNRATGGLGHVEHEFKRRSLYQRIGNFFIGAAPMIFGSLVLFLLLRWLVPNAGTLFHLVEHPDITQPGELLTIGKDALLTLFSPANRSTWHFWLFLYLSFCVVSHIAPSKQDRRGMWSGFFLIVILILLANVIALLVKKNITETILSVNIFFGPLFAIFIYAIFVSLMHLVASTIILFPFRRR